MPFDHVNDMFLMDSLANGVPAPEAVAAADDFREWYEEEFAERTRIGAPMLMMEASRVHDGALGIVSLTVPPPLLGLGLRRRCIQAMGLVCARHGAVLTVELADAPAPAPRSGPLFDEDFILNEPGLPEFGAFLMRPPVPPSPALLHEFA